jgi:hypothetical protein
MRLNSWVSFITYSSGGPPEHLCTGSAIKRIASRHRRGSWQRSLAMSEKSNPLQRTGTISAQVRKPLELKYKLYSGSMWSYGHHLVKQKPQPLVPKKRIISDQYIAPAQVLKTISTRFDKNTKPDRRPPLLQGNSWPQKHIRLLDVAVKIGKLLRAVL